MMTIKTKILASFLCLATAGVARAAIAGEAEPLTPAYSDFQGKTIGFAFPDRQSMNIQKVFRDNAVYRARELGWKVIETDAKWDVGTQSKNILSLAARSDVAGIVMLSIDYVANNNAVKQFEATGRPVVVYHMGISYPSAGHVGPNFYQMGRLFAKTMTEDLGGKGKIALILGDPNSQSAVDDLRGMKEWLKENKSGLEIVFEQPANWDAEKAKQVTKTLLQQHPDVAGIWCNWDVQCVGMGQALKEAGQVGKIKTWTEAASDVCFTGLQEGYFTKCIGWDTRDQVRRAVDLVSMLVESGWKQGDKGIVWNVPLYIVTKDNMNDPRVHRLAFGEHSGYVSGESN
ncbi:MAG: sugar ABC transporter substrate-binding protein [Xanthobacteraceae bacterium]|jgi:ABC-type sugar transport system substrate-binding protein